MDCCLGAVLLVELAGAPDLPLHPASRNNDKDMLISILYTIIQSSLEISWWRGAVPLPPMVTSEEDGSTVGVCGLVGQEPDSAAILGFHHGQCGHVHQSAGGD